jgi:hypothetical protein
MSNPVFIRNNINNNQLSFKKAMPLKDSTSDGTSDFELGRKIYSRTYNPPLSDASINKLLRTPYFGQNHSSRILPTVFDGTHAPVQKKWMGSTNRDSSQITTNRRTNSVGKGSLNYSNQPVSFTSSDQVNVVNDALRRVRAGGAVAPPKKNASPSHTYVPSPGTHPYMQPGYKGKNAGYFPTSRYNIQCNETVNNNKKTIHQ